MARWWLKGCPSSQSSPVGRRGKTSRSHPCLPEGGFAKVSKGREVSGQDVCGGFRRGDATAHNAGMSAKPVEVVIATSLTDDLIERIEKVDARVHVADAAARLFEELPSALRPGQEPAPDRSGGRSLDALLSRAEVLLAARRLPADMGRRAPNLRWIQLPLAGSEWARGLDVWRDPNVAITSGAGISAGPVAEWVVTQMLTLAKQVGRMVRGQRARQWDRFDLAQLRGATIGIVGFGAIGRETARLAAAFGMRVLAVKRNLADVGLAGAEVEVLPPSALDRVLREADFLVLAAPSTPETRGMIGARELSLMKPTAYFINPARGDLVDEPALLAALAERRIAGAALDVLQSEPPPADSPWWEVDNALVTAHVAGLSEGYDDAVVDLFLDNLGRYLAGEPLRNVVDRARAY